MSRKNLKKFINNSIEILINDCIFYKVFTEKPNVDKADALLLKIVDAHTDLITRISTSEGKDVKGRTKAYYNKIKSDLEALVNEFGKEIQQLD